jgi:hypothetical protein
VVSGVVTLGSPHRDQLAVHPLLWTYLVTLSTVGTLGLRGVMRLRCRGRHVCCRGFDRTIAAPLPEGVWSLSVYSRRDGLVDWRACIDPAGDNLEVRAAHLAMPTDGNTLAAIARALEQH